MKKAVEMGSEKAFEIGPGKVLTGLLRRIDRNLSCSPIGTTDAIKDMLDMGDNG